MTRTSSRVNPHSIVCLKTKIHLNIFRYISTYILSCRIKKKEKTNISTMKTHQMPNKWQHLTSSKISFSNLNLQNDIVASRLYYVNESCIIIKFIWIIFAYN